MQVLCRKFGEFGEKEEGEKEGDSEVLGKASLKLSSAMPFLLCSFSGSLLFVSLLLPCSAPVSLSCPYTVFLTQNSTPSCFFLNKGDEFTPCGFWLLRLLTVQPGASFFSVSSCVRW